MHNSDSYPSSRFRPLLKFAYPENFWKGLCETCLDSAQKTYSSINKDEIFCRRNKCVLCGKKGRVYPVEIQIPDFSKGIVKNRQTSAQTAWIISIRPISGLKETILKVRLVNTGMRTKFE